MSGLVKLWAKQIGWRIGQRNVIVEGTIDVSFVESARKLYRRDNGIDILDGGLAVIAAGRRDDGGVEGVNRRLNAARQIAESEAFNSGTQNYRFIGLFDNDGAGRRAIRQAQEFDRRVIPYRDVFLLHPVMPPAGGVGSHEVKRRAKSLNSAYDQLDWEIEDLISEDFLQAFEKKYPGNVKSKTSKGGLTHRELTQEGKVKLIEFVKQKATLADMMEIIRLVCALRDYLDLPHSHIATEG